MIKGHFHWVFECSNYVNGGETIGWSHRDMVQVTVVGQANEDSARASVEELVVRSEYKLVKVYECVTCAAQSASAQYLKQLAKDA